MMVPAAKPGEWGCGRTKHRSVQKCHLEMMFNQRFLLSSIKEADGFLFRFMPLSVKAIGAEEEEEDSGGRRRTPNQRVVSRPRRRSIHELLSSAAIVSVDTREKKKKDSAVSLKCHNCQFTVKLLNWRIFNEQFESPDKMTLGLFKSETYIWLDKFYRHFRSRVFGFFFFFWYYAGLKQDNCAYV